jgi:hypothetical protein
MLKAWAALLFVVMIGTAYLLRMPPREHRQRLASQSIAETGGRAAGAIMSWRSARGGFTPAPVVKAENGRDSARGLKHAFQQKPAHLRQGSPPDEQDAMFRLKFPLLGEENVPSRAHLWHLGRGARMGHPACGECPACS